MANIFISYSHENEVEVQQLVQLLERMHHNVRFDQDHSGGAVWWSSILQDVRNSKIFIIALSYQYLDSYACVLERDYAEKLGKLILPIMVREVKFANLQSSISQVNVVKFVDRNSEQVVNLVASINDLDSKPNPPLPDPLPVPPEAPIPRVSVLLEEINDYGVKLSLERQESLANELINLMQKSDNRRNAKFALEQLYKRPELEPQLANKVIRKIQPLRHLLPIILYSILALVVIIGVYYGGKYIFTVVSTPTITPIPATTAQLVSQFKPLSNLPSGIPPEGPVAWSKDGKHVAVAGVVDGKGVILIYPTQNLNTAPQQIPLKQQGFTITSIAFSPDGHEIAAGGEDNILYISDIASSSVRLSLPMSNCPTLTIVQTCWVRDVDYSPNGEQIATASWNHNAYVEVWDAKTGNPLSQFQDKRGPSQPVFSAAFSPDGRFIAIAGDEQKIWIWEWEWQAGTAPAKIISDPIITSKLRSVAYSPNGKYIAAGGWGNTLYLWNAITGKTISQVVPGSNPNIDRIENLAFSPDGSIIISGGDDKILRFWVPDPLQLLNNTLSDPLGRIFSIAFSPEGRQIIAGGDGYPNSKALIWGVS